MKDPDDSHPRRPGRLIDWPRSKLRQINEGVRQDLSGVWHVLGYVRHLLRGNRIRRSSLFESIDDLHPPVLLIHGYLGTRGALYVLEHRLKADGISVFSFNLGTLNVRDIRGSAFLIHRKVETILAQTSVKKIDIIGHSMGGLIGLYYVKKLGGHEKVRKLIMLGTPIKGTWAALLGVFTPAVVSASAWQLLPGSRFLGELESGELPEGVQYFTIAAQRDRLCPQESASVDGAEALTVPLGHTSLVIGAEAYRHILWALRK